MGTKAINTFDPVPDYNRGVMEPPNNAFAVTPNNANELPFVARELYVGVAGDISVIHAGDSVAVVYKDVQGLLCGFFKQVNATGTTATSIIARY
jgi:hypothetical protein